MTDEQLRQFITNGYLVIQSQLPAEFHARIFDKLHNLASSSGHFGNNLMPMVPELNQVIEEPKVVGPYRAFWEITTVCMRIAHCMLTRQAVISRHGIRTVIGAIHGGFEITVLGGQC